MNLRTTLICGLTLFVTFSTAAQDLPVPIEPVAQAGRAPQPGQVLSLDLQSAYEMALLRNLDLQIGRYSVANASSRVTGASGVFDPNLTLGVSGDSTESPAASQLDGADIQISGMITVE